jgi:hypothetical protein
MGEEIPFFMPRADAEHADAPALAASHFRKECDHLDARAAATSRNAVS